MRHAGLKKIMTRGVSATIVVLALVVCASLTACQGGSRTKLNIGGGLNISMLAIVAEQEGFFKAQGVDAEFHTLQNGKVAFDAVAANQMDLGIVTDANIAALGHAGLGDVRVLGTITSKTDDALVARRDAHIATPADLNGKKIAYVPAGTSEVFLALFAKARGIDLQGDKPIVMTAQAMQAAITHRDVDAVSVWQPFRLNIMSALGANGIEFVNGGVYPAAILLIAKQQTLSARSGEVIKVLKALVAASQYIKTHREESITLLAKAIGVDRDSLDKSWAEYQFGVSADPALNSHLDDVAGAFAVIEPGFDKGGQPDFTPYLDQSLVANLTGAAVSR